MSSKHQVVAELGFYPFDDVAWAYDKLWNATAKKCSWLPRELTRSSDPTKLWLAFNFTFYDRHFIGQRHILDEVTPPVCDKQQDQPRD